MWTAISQNIFGSVVERLTLAMEVFGSNLDATGYFFLNIYKSDRISADISLSISEIGSVHESHFG